jgi:hypothetical protein
MVYREQDERALCGLCAGFAESRCRRCGQPRCAEHALADDVRCKECEVEFEGLVVRDQKAALSRMITGKLKRPVLGLLGLGAGAALIAGVAASWEIAAMIGGVTFFILMAICMLVGFTSMFLLEAPDVYSTELRDESRALFLSELRYTALIGDGDE